MPLLAKLGVFELAAAAWSGWVMVIIVEHPEWLERVGVRHMHRLRQSHIDLLMMGTIVTVLGVAVQPIATWAAAGIVASAYLQPFGFVPLAFNGAIRERRSYRVVNGVLFAAMTAGFASVVVQVAGR